MSKLHRATCLTLVNVIMQKFENDYDAILWVTNVIEHR